MSCDCSAKACSFWDKCGTVPPEKLQDACPFCSQPFAFHIPDPALSGDSSAALQCNVPSFPIHPLWNPTGDLFSIRPIDLLRKQYDELGNILRYFVVSHLLNPMCHVYLEGGRGAQGWVGWSLYFTAHRHIKVDRKATPVLQGAAFTPDSIKRLKEKHPELFADGNQANVAVNLDQFFDLRISWDCDKLLRHIKFYSRYYGKKASMAALQLFWLRNVVFHRSFLAQGGFSSTAAPQQHGKKRVLSPDGDKAAGCIHEYCVRALLMFDELVKRLFHDSKQTPRALRFEEQIGVHSKQLSTMRTLANHWAKRFPRFVDQRQGKQKVRVNQFAQPVTAESLDTFIGAVKQEAVLPRVQTDLAIVFGSRFFMQYGSIQPKEAEPAAAASAVKSPAPTDVSSVLGLGESVRKWDWDPSSQSLKPHDYTLQDPLGVSHADMMWRIIDAMCVLLQELLFVVVWDHGDNTQRAALAERITLLKSLKLTQAGLPFDVLIRERKDDWEHDDQYKVNLQLDSAENQLQFFDPGLLVQSTRNIIEVSTDSIIHHTTSARKLLAFYVC